MLDCRLCGATKAYVAEPGDRSPRLVCQNPNCPADTDSVSTTQASVTEI